MRNGLFYSVCQQRNPSCHLPSVFKGSSRKICREEANLQEGEDFWRRFIQVYVFTVTKRTRWKAVAVLWKGPGRKESSF